jgi:hypothetical protein
MAIAFSAEPGAATPPSPLCRNENLRNLLWRQFAARLVGAVDVRLGRNSGGAGYAVRLVWNFASAGAVLGAARRRGCRTSVCQDAGFTAQSGPAACDMAQALHVAGFFGLSARCAGANCLQFAATRLKFDARLG